MNVAAVEPVDPNNDEVAVEDVADVLRVACRRLTRGLRLNDDLDLSPTLRAALGTIHRKGPITLGELATIEQVAPPSITKITSKLVDAGYIVRRVHEADRRVVWVELTPEGQHQVDATREHGNSWLAGLLQDRTPAELATLHTAGELVLRLLTAAERGS